MVTQLNKDFFLIPIPMPNNPLKTLNAYLIRGEKCLLIDTGFNIDVCETAMLAALRELDVSKERLDIFITHFHSDHVGLANRLLTPSSRLLCNKRIGRLDANYIMEKQKKFNKLHLTSNAFNVPVGADAPARVNEFDIGFTEIPENVRYLSEGDTISYGEYHFTYIDTPGHAFDHGCLYETNKKWLFCGDCILKDITPNISSFSPEENPLEEYMKSLDKIADNKLSVAYCGHGQPVTDIHSRIEEIKAHHSDRLAEVVGILSDGSFTAEAIASKMQWNIEESDWDRFSRVQKYFATSEAAAHLVYLYKAGKVKRTENNLGLFFSNIDQDGK